MMLAFSSLILIYIAYCFGVKRGYDFCKSKVTKCVLEITEETDGMKNGPVFSHRLEQIVTKEV